MFETIILIVLSLLSATVAVALFLLYQLCNELQEVHNMIEDFTNDKYYR